MWKINGCFFVGSLPIKASIWPWGDNTTIPLDASTEANFFSARFKSGQSRVIICYLLWSGPRGAFVIVCGDEVCAVLVQAPGDQYTCHPDTEQYTANTEYIVIVPSHIVIHLRVLKTRSLIPSSLFCPCDVKYPDTDLLWLTNFNHNFASTPTSKFAIICTRLKLQIILYLHHMYILYSHFMNVSKILPPNPRKMIWKGFI